MGFWGPRKELGYGGSWDPTGPYRILRVPYKTQKELEMWNG